MALRFVGAFLLLLRLPMTKDFGVKNENWIGKMNPKR